MGDEVTPPCDAIVTTITNGCDKSYSLMYVVKRQFPNIGTRGAGSRFRQFGFGVTFSSAHDSQVRSAACAWHMIRSLGIYPIPLKRRRGQWERASRCGCLS